MINDFLSGATEHWYNCDRHPSKGPWHVIATLLSHTTLCICITVSMPEIESHDLHSYVVGRNLLTMGYPGDDGRERVQE
jgi:hypothetical protein